MSLFRLHGHTLDYGPLRVWENLDLEIRAGEKVALVGPSGAGKSSLLKVLHSQQAPDIALCPQDGALIDVLSVYLNVYMGQLEQSGLLRNAWNMLRPLPGHRRAIAALCEELGIADKLFVSVDQLSGGQRQRVAVARALYRDRPIFFGDEPVSSLDPLQGRLLLESILARHETAVVALHDSALTLASFDRVIAIRQGRIEFDEAAGDIDTHTLDRLYAQ